MVKYLDRQSIRLKDYDYSSVGYYFVTMCTQNNKNLFGEINDGKLNLNHAGNMVIKWVCELENKYSIIYVDKYVVIPNHFHIIIIIDSAHHEGRHKELPLQLNPALSDIIQWFKTMTTNDYIKGVKSNIYPPFDKRIWQRNYYEHIIRQDQEYIKICEYIENNPLKWSEDKYYQK